MPVANVDEPEVPEELRRTYFTARAREYLVTWMASDPRPTREQRQELAELLLGGDSRAAA